MSIPKSRFFYFSSFLNYPNIYLRLFILLSSVSRHILQFLTEHNIKQKMVQFLKLIIQALVFLLFCIQPVSTLLSPFQSSVFPNSFQAIICFGYVGQQVCQGNKGNISNSSFWYKTFSPNTTYFAEIDGINEQIPQTGFIGSYSNPRFYVSTNSFGGVYQLDLGSKSLNLLFHQNFSAYTNIFIEADKSAIPKYYYFLVTNVSSTQHITYICFQILPSATCTPFLTLNTRVVAVSINEYNRIHILQANHSSNTTVFSIIDQNGGIIYNLTKNMIGTKNFLVSSFNFIVFSLNGFIYVFDSNVSSIIWTTMVTIPKRVMDLKLIYPYLMVFDQFTVIKQFNITDGTLFGTVSTGNPNYYMVFMFDNTTQSYNLDFRQASFWNQLWQTIPNDQYPTGSPPCSTGYTYNGGVSTCVSNNPNNVIKKYFQMIPIAPLIPPNPINPSVALINTSQYTSCLNPENTLNNQQCLIFCSQRCQSCKQQKNICDICSQFYTLQNNSAICQVQTQVKFIWLVYVIFHTFKHSSTITAFAFLHNFDLYQYHLIRYQGIVQSILNFTRFIQEKQWQIIPISGISDIFDKIWFIRGNYYPFTLQGWLNVQRKDSNFVENIKQYLFFFTPYVIIIFFFINRLFKFLFNYRISFMLRTFSFWLYMIGIILLNDLERLTYLSFMQLTNLFRFSFCQMFVHCWSILLIGLYFISTLSIYFFYLKFYSQQSRYFLGNIKIVGNQLKSVLFVSLRYVIKPILQGVTHRFLYSDIKTQIISLFLIDLIFLLCTILIQLKLSLIKVKLLFAIDSIIQMLSCLITILLYIKFIEIGKDTGQENAYNLAQQCLKVCIYISGSFLGLLFCLGLVETLFSWCFVKEKTVKQVRTRQTNSMNGLNKRLEQLKNQRRKKKRKIKNVRKYSNLQIVQYQS